MKIILYVLSNSNYMFDKLVFNSSKELFFWTFSRGYSYGFLREGCCYLYEYFINGNKRKIGVIYVEQN